MKVTPTAVIMPLLLVLLTWLSLRAINTDAELFDRALGALDRFAIIESTLHRDVLSARAGMLRNYDPLVREVNALDATVVQLRKTAAVDGKTSVAIDRFASLVARQEVLVEQFKSDNALLQNSLAYFGLFIARLNASDRAGPVIPAVSGLAASMLHLTLDTSSMTADDVENWLRELASQPVPHDDAANVQGLLAHGRLLHDLLPATDSILKALYVLPQKPDRGAVRTLVLAHQMASRTTARRYRLLLYVTSVLLVGVLAHFALRLRARARELQQRAAFEHIIAGMSTRFIGAQPQKLKALMEQALAELAEWVGADRAYFASTCPNPEPLVWSREGVTYPPGWPNRALELATGLGPAADGTIHIPSVERMPVGPDRDVLIAAGLHGWICVPLFGGEIIIAILGFDALRPWSAHKTKALGLLRMVHDAVANAIRREMLEQEKLRLEQHLQQTRRMETVGALASGIAHNFNNIIDAILGYAEMTEAQVAPDSRPARNLWAIRRAGERARDLVNQILTFGRRHDVRRRPVNVQDLIAEAASLLRASLPKEIELTINDASESAVLFCDQTQLQQVILNLCNNAAQAMDGTGRIDVDVELHEIALELPLTHGDLVPGRYVRIAVTDAGRGMDKATLHRIFEAFFTTRLAGNGLGLPTVQEIVREHGGTMNVRSTAGAGSCFEVWLPCISGAASRSGQQLPTLPLGRGETVLVVEDEREQLLREEEILAALGYEPVGFPHADDALAACKDAPDRFDMLVVGHLVPTTSTLEVAAALHEIVPGLPILLATASADDISTDLLVAAGISDVVQWPIVTHEIAAALERCSVMRRFEGRAQLS